MAGGGDGFEVVVGFVQLIRRRNMMFKGGTMAISQLSETVKGRVFDS